MRRILLLGLVAFALVACAKPKPPAGRWEGAYESGGTLIAARLEIAPDGGVRVSAPDLTDVADEDRDGARTRLAGDLAAGWDQVAPRTFDFDGETFRKPGGIAPQMIWKEKTRRMSLVVYLGTRPGLRIPLRAVDGFSDDPFMR
ncbi:MAG: hypothetical protein JO261_12700 [Alphaproteobacteria bacterium]|nr:hypothetical protein [Alphaproteobacteria bacterium]MBV9694550.1 hypothetical protein [Alphaproteobacteria bacterium]